MILFRTGTCVMSLWWITSAVLKVSGTGLRTTWLRHSYFLCEADSSFFSITCEHVSGSKKKIKIWEVDIWMTRVVSQTFSCVKYQHVIMSNTRLNSLWFRILCFCVTIKWFHSFWDIHLTQPLLHTANTVIMKTSALHSSLLSYCKKYCVHHIN